LASSRLLNIQPIHLRRSVATANSAFGFSKNCSSSVEPLSAVVDDRRPRLDHGSFGLSRLTRAIWQAIKQSPLEKESGMAARLLVLRAGSGASNNLIHSLKIGEPSLFIVGCHDDRFVLKKSAADRNYLAPVSSRREFARALQHIVETERIDLLIPNNDDDVWTISELRAQIPCRVFLPPKEVIERCQDKYVLTRFLRRRGLPAPLTYAITSLDEIEKIFRRFGPRSQLWCRIRKGTGSFGAIPVKTPEQVRSWIKYWQEMRGVPEGFFTLSEYLPGRDFCVQCLWNEGTLVLTKMAERLSYIDGGSPSGVSSTPALAKTAFEPHIIDVCATAVRALDPKVSGVFFLDVKESSDQRPCITEINAGRFATITNIHDLAGKHNMAVIYVRLALGESVGLIEACDFASDHYLVRSLDTLPAILHASELFESIDDAR
jgi:ATP-grasp domain